MPGSVVAYIAISIVVPVGVIILAIVAIAGGRAEPDPNRERPRALYLTAAAFVGIFTLLFAAFGVATSLLNLTTDDEDGSVRYSQAVTVERGSGSMFEDDGGPPDRVILKQGVSGPDEDDRDVSDAVQAGIVALLGAGIYVAHDRRLRRFLAVAGDPGRRVADTYAYVTCFVALFTAVAAAGVALYAAFRAIAPGVTGTGNRADAVVQLVATGLLAAGAAAVYLRHWRMAEAGPALPPEVVTPPPLPPPPSTSPSPAPAPARKAAKKTVKKATTSRRS